MPSKAASELPLEGFVRARITSYNVCYTKLLRRILTNLQSCQERNEVNGKLIELNLLSNRKLAADLCLLRDKNKLTYDHRGNTQPGKNGSLNIKA